MQEQNQKNNTKYLIGNWKANKTLEEAESWISKVKSEKINPRHDLKVVLCPSFIHINIFQKLYPDLCLGCQDISPFGDGAYTGEVTARMLANIVKFAILGHSERHKYFSESCEMVALKAIQAVDNDLTPIIAVTKDGWLRQINNLEEKIKIKSIIMYEPPEAISQQIGPIGKGDPAPLEEVVYMIRKIKDGRKFKAVIYGGSVKSHNIKDFINEPIIDGVLPGSASLNASEWIKMLQIANDTQGKINNK